VRVPRVGRILSNEFFGKIVPKIFFQHILCPSLTLTSARRNAMMYPSTEARFSLVSVGSVKSARAVAHGERDNRRRRCTARIVPGPAAEKARDCHTVCTVCCAV